MRRALKVAGLVVLGAVLSASGFLSWYHWGRGSTSPTALHVVRFSDSWDGMLMDSCQVNAAGDEVNALGTFNATAANRGIANLIELRVDSRQSILATVKMSVRPSAGGVWNLSAHLLQGFGTPTTCLFGLFYSSN
jgi:hypothetical protein